MTAALWKGPGVGTAEINSEHNCLSRSSLQQVKFPHTLYEKKKKKPTQMAAGQALHIPKYYRRNADQNDKKSNPTCQNGHPHKSTNNKCGRELGEEGTSLHGQWEWTLATAIRKDSFLMPGKKKKNFPEN